MLISRLSSKSQITLPKKIREAVGLHPGDAVLYDIHEDGVVELKRMEPFDVAFHKSVSKTLDEWATPEDDKAFHDL